MTKTWLTIESMDELHRHEKAILERIEATPNGPLLFLLHPFLLFGDLGVELGDAVKRELLAIEPDLHNVAPEPYAALRASDQPQRVRIRLHGLFRRRAV